MNRTTFSAWLSRRLRPHGKQQFLASLRQDARILDVGCGNDSPRRVKAVLPHAHYTGLDVGDYNQSSASLADDYILTTGQRFAEEIRRFPAAFDAVISSHNLEHCDERDATFAAMRAALKVGGRMFLSFPSERSTHFPHRMGTLNYRDDPTHKDEPPCFASVVKGLVDDGFQIEFATPSYRPVLLAALGLLVEPVSRLRRRVMRGTWELYGFEAIVVARRCRPRRDQ